MNKNLEDIVKSNPYDYESHFALIEQCRIAGDFVKAREFRNSANSIFPLSSQQWRDWIQDEIAIDPSRSGDLYQRAALETLDVDLWEEYLDFIKDQMGSDRVLEVLYQATTAVGWHFTNGYKIWDKLWEYQLEQLEQDNIKDAQEIGKIRDSFYKRSDMLMSDASFDNLLIAYSGFESKVGNNYEEMMKKFTRLVSKAKKECSKRDFYEQKLVFFLF